MLENFPAEDLASLILTLLTDSRYASSLSRGNSGWHTNVSIVSGCLLLKLPPKTALSCGNHVFQNGGSLTVDIPGLQNSAVHGEASWIAFLAHNDLRKYLLNHREIVSSSKVFDHNQKDSDSISTGLDFVAWTTPPFDYHRNFGPALLKSNLTGAAALIGLCGIVANIISEAVRDVKTTMSPYGFRLISQD